MHVSTIIFDRLVSKRRDVLGWSDEEVKKYRQMLRLASLLHDIGHAPFSHVSDDLFDEIVKSHEGMAGKIITDSDITMIIDKIGREYGFNASAIAAMVTGQTFFKEEQLLCDIFASELDADKMDYLLRDSLYTGVKYGYFDLERILNVISMFPKDGSWKIGIEYDGVEAVEGLILARYFMFTQVYLHRTRRVYDKIMIQVLKEVLKEKYGMAKLPSEPEKFKLWDDYSVIENAKTIDSPWAAKFLNRAHLKCVWQTELASTKEERERQRKADSIIKEELEKKYQPYQIIVDLYQKPPLKFTLADGVTPTINVISKENPIHTYSFRDRAPVVAKLEEPIYVFRVYSEEDIAQEVRDFIQMRSAILNGGN